MTSFQAARGIIVYSIGRICGVSISLSRPVLCVILSAVFVGIECAASDVVAAQSQRSKLSNSVREALIEFHADGWLTDNDGNLLQISMQDLRDSTIASVVKRFPKLKSVLLNSEHGLSPEGIKYLEQLPQLEEIGLNLTERTEELTDALSQLTNLRILGFSVDNFGADDFVNLSKLRNVEVLRFVWRDADDAMIANLISRFPQLNELELAGPAVRNQALAEVGRHIRIKKLTLTSCSELTGKDMSHICGLPKLLVLDLSSGITKRNYDELLAQVGRATTLRELHISINHTDVGMKHLASLVNLEVYDDYSTSITDSALDVFSAMPKLRKLALHSPKISGEGLVHLKNLDQLEWVSLKHTGLRPEFVGHLARLKSLAILDVSWSPMDKDNNYASLCKLKELPLKLISILSTDEGAQELQKVFPNCKIDNLE